MKLLITWRGRAHDGRTMEWASVPMEIFENTPLTRVIPMHPRATSIRIEAVPSKETVT